MTAPSPIALSWLEIARAIEQVVPAGFPVALVHSFLGLFGTGRGLVDECLHAWMWFTENRGITLAMPTFTIGFCQTRTFDPALSPSETGALTEAFRKAPGVVRGEHPIYSFAAIGPEAEAITAHRGETCWGSGTPFEFLEARNALIVMFGCPWSVATIMHREEEKMGVPYRYFKAFDGVVHTRDGVRAVAPKFMVRRLDLPAENDFRGVERLLRSRRQIASVPLGRGRIEAASSLDLLKATRETIEGRKHNLGLLKEPEKYLEEAAGRSSFPGNGFHGGQEG